MAIRGSSLWTDVPQASAMNESLCVSPGNSHSKCPTRFANTSSALTVANDIPGHPRLPAPNGINSKSFPFMSSDLFKNLSGFLLWIVPRSRVSMYSPSIDDNVCPCSNVIILDFGIVR
ncbi:hypothetical protein RND81_04G107500 [Saponaria officinalis]|uniref:Uncharacterized protein n=1 Tax=Saponaria officinalis TaxID=3572 RepID=A0AAW1LLR7_SAPOF